MVTPVLAGFFLALTGLILIWDLEHPDRFVFIFLRPQWRSWLVRGAVIISLYGLILAAHFAFGLLGQLQATRALAIAGVPLAILASVYTAYLFAQAKGRDLWQSPLLPPHVLVQALILGMAVYVLLGQGQARYALVVLTVPHLLLPLGELTIGHPTAHAHQAAREMTRRLYSRHFWAGVGLALIALGAIWVPPVAALAALLAVFLHEHAYVQSGQSVPLA